MCDNRETTLKLLTVVVNPVSPSVSMLLPQQQCKGCLKSVKLAEKRNYFVDVLLCANFLSTKQSEYTCFFIHSSGSSHERPSQPHEQERAACSRVPAPSISVACFVAELKPISCCCI